ncbi:MAG: hypothetical protein KAQ94_02730 [Arcobacteraceae bacterium]|nr:hypothetical protein [Arcobacteraceae bacterium]
MKNEIKLNFQKEINRLISLLDIVLKTQRLTLSFEIIENIKISKKILNNYLIILNFQKKNNATTIAELILCLPTLLLDVEQYRKQIS